MNVSTCVHVLNIDDYFPELAELTLPTIEAFSRRIGAELNVITDRRFPDRPFLTEKLQVYRDGMKYDFNILLDLDILIHPNCYNPFMINIPETHVAFKDAYDADSQLRPDTYFMRDGRNVGVSACAVFSTRMTHDLWKPISDLTKKEINDNILQDRKIVDEYVLSRNLAKYGLRYVSPYPMNEYNYMLHLGVHGADKNRMIDKAKEWHRLIWAKR